MYLAKVGFMDADGGMKICITKLEAFRAIRSALFVTSTPHLRCEFESGRGITRGIQELASFIDKLSHIGRLVISFHLVGFKSGVPQWGGRPAIKKATWVGLMRHLLTTIARKRCADLTIFDGKSQSPVDIGHELLPKLELESEEVELDASSQRKQHAKPTAIRQATNLLKRAVNGGFRPFTDKYTSLALALQTHGPQETMRLSRNLDPELPPLTSLTTVSFALTGMLLHKPILDWTISTLNAAPIVWLFVGYYGTPSFSSEECGILLSQITMTSLTSLSITNLNLDFAHFSDFLSRHKVTSLDLGVTKLVPPDTSVTSPLPAPVLSQFRSLCGTPESISALLHGADSLPALDALSFSHMNLYPDLHIVKVLEDTLQQISTICNRSNLHISLYFYEHSSSRHLFVDLKFNHDEAILGVRPKGTSQPHTAEIFARVPHWMGLYRPKLASVVFQDLLWMDAAKREALVRAIREVCPGLQFVTIEGHKRPVEEFD
jgi:hypothetical protein